MVVVGWNDSTAAVTSVTDTLGNTYMLAVGPTAVSGTLSQSIYYAKNIVAAGAGANTVTVKFNPAALIPDIRTLEYSGLDQANPLDVTAAGTGSSGTAERSRDNHERQRSALRGQYRIHRELGSWRGIHRPHHH